MYIPRNFKAHELVDQKTYEHFGQSAFQLFRDDILRGLDELRDLVNRPLIVNNWKDGGQYEWSGLRTIDCYTGAKWSPHRLGAAFDIKCPTMGVTELQKFILQQSANGNLKTITRMELNTPTWTHIDCLWTVYPYIYQFKA
ncbi:MAG TPA: hypothetical protein DD730_18765 [Desulfosporosinus sp.]|jgi:hypothetical protein|nr:hypothetical protein [Desulfosporosinus sp.]